ncbi:hypothetical protein E2C01_018454 [Portunus trituberculatus]|uniref:Uncharacterized protein n=1 Tax=Portunus trituberculatus TaxID=210409 RepID=A0A5B7DW68_PORTR|nr:hypothetical protein [Portunus trituberculatus]
MHLGLGGAVALGILPGGHSPAVSVINIYSQAGQGVNSSTALTSNTKPKTPIHGLQRLLPLKPQLLSLPQQKPHL